MRFRGTLILLIICAAFAGYLYFYEIKGGEKREKAKQAESRVWSLDSSAIQQIDLTIGNDTVAVARTGDKDWKIIAPRTLDADATGLNALSQSAAEINRESVIETNAGDLSRFGLQPPKVNLKLKTKDGKEYNILFGNNNPTGNSTYATVGGTNEVFLVANSVTSNFNKKLEDLRNHSILSFEQYEAQSLELKSSKDDVQLVKENDSWFSHGDGKWAASTTAVNEILSSLANGRIKEFFDENPAEYVNLGFDNPSVDVRITVGKDKALKHLIIGNEKSALLKKGEKKPALIGANLYLAKDESRNDMFFVDKTFIDTILKQRSDLRDKALAAFQRWDIDSIILTNSKGTFSFTKSGGDWVLGDAKKKTNWEAVNGILDALEKPIKEFIDKPEPPAAYGFDKPSARVVLKQGQTVKADLVFGKETKDGIYAQVQGEATAKLADKESFDKINKAEPDFVASEKTPEASTTASGR
jgi:hypothetical protein